MPAPKGNKFAEGNKGGRPKREIDTLAPGWQKKILQMKKQGAADVEVRAELGISIDLWQRWIDEIEEFAETIKKGDDLCEAWWVKHGRMQLENRRFSAVLWYMNMKNRFGWKDKTETEHTVAVSFIEAIRQAKVIAEEKQKALLQQPK